MHVLYDLAAERFGRQLASIGLCQPTILTADFAVFEDLPDGEICLIGDETRSLRLLAVSSLLENHAVVHSFETIDREPVLVIIRLTPGGHAAVALKPGDVPWQWFLRQRSIVAAA